MKTIQLDNQEIQIALNREEAEQLRKSQQDPNCVVHIHGSNEHIECLRLGHQLHTGKAQALREQHPDLHAKIDQINHDVNTFSRELAELTSSPVELRENFEKFGFDPKLRVYSGAADEEAAAGGEDMVDGAVAAGIHLHKHDQSHRPKSTTIKVYKKPVLRQYYHNGILYRARNLEEVASCELFVDLLYVGIIAFSGDKATEDATVRGFLEFTVTFIPSFKIWIDLTLLISQFETDDLTQRTLVLFVLVCLVGYTSNIVSAYDTTWKQLISFYLSARFFYDLFSMWMGVAIPHIRNVMLLTSAVGWVSICLWLGSVWIPWPHREGLIWAAIWWDLFARITVGTVIRTSKGFSKTFHQRLLTLFEYVPALNIEHKTERTGAFISLVFGYSVVALLYQSQAPFGLNAFWGKATLGLIQAYCFNIIYFDIDGSYHHVHAIRRHPMTSGIWNLIHLPFMMAFTLYGSALSKLVIAHDCPNADPDTLTPTFQAKSEGEVSDGWRWFYCGGLAVSLSCMAIISACHVHQAHPTQRIRKRFRLAFRVVIATIWLCLPLATRLNSLELIGTTTGMTVLALAFDIYGMSCKDDSFFGQKAPQYDRNAAQSEVGSETSAERQEGLLDFMSRSY